MKNLNIHNVNMADFFIVSAKRNLYATTAYSKIAKHQVNNQELSLLMFPPALNDR